MPGFGHLLQHLYRDLHSCPMGQARCLVWETGSAMRVLVTQYLCWRRPPPPTSMALEGGRGSELLDSSCPSTSCSANLTLTTATPCWWLTWGSAPAWAQPSPASACLSAASTEKSKGGELSAAHVPRELDGSCITGDFPRPCSPLPSFADALGQWDR